MASLHGIPDAKELINSDETFSYYWGTVAVVKCIRTVVFAAMVNFPGGYGIRPYAVEGDARHDPGGFRWALKRFPCKLSLYLLQ